MDGEQSASDAPRTKVIRAADLEPGDVRLGPRHANLAPLFLAGHAPVWLKLEGVRVLEVKPAESGGRDVVIFEPAEDMVAALEALDRRVGAEFPGLTYRPCVRRPASFGCYAHRDTRPGFVLDRNGRPTHLYGDVKGQAVDAVVTLDAVCFRRGECGIVRHLMKLRVCRGGANGPS